jgi:ABC-type microcin C transport system duplicated ATPase subunit YejF
MATGNLRHRLAISMAFLNDPDLLVIRRKTVDTAGYAA